jgi:hypothetical protein
MVLPPHLSVKPAANLTLIQWQSRLSRFVSRALGSAAQMSIEYRASAHAEH